MIYVVLLAALAVTLAVQFLTRNIDNSFLTRLISGIVLVELALLLIGRGGAVLYFATLVLSLVGVFELYRATGIHPEKHNLDLLELTGYVGVVVYYISVVVLSGRYQLLALLLCLVMLMSVYVFTYPKYTADHVMMAFFGIMYVGVMLSFIYQTRMLATGRYLVWLIFLCSWGCDTCAYCIGMLIGKHKMSPILSPKKTIEGAIGGILGAALLGILYSFVAGGPWWAYAIICIVGGLISMVGDLAASAVKRNMGIKDYGRLIPGHGGVMDRFDSVIFVAPIIYFLSVGLVR